MQLLHAPSWPHLSFQTSDRNSKGGLLSLEKCLQLSTANCSFQPQKLERSIWVSHKRNFFSFCATKATSVEAGSSAASSGTAEGDVLKALSQIIDPDFGTDIVTCGFVKDLLIDEASGEVSFRLELTTPACPIKDMVNHIITTV